MLRLATKSKDSDSLPESVTLPKDVEIWKPQLSFGTVRISFLEYKTSQSSGGLLSENFREIFHEF